MNQQTNQAVNEVKITSEVKIRNDFTNTGPTIAFTFTCLCFLSWANSLGWFGTGYGFTLALGTIQLGMYGAYLGGSFILSKNGAPFGGNIFMIFASFFGGVGGVTNVSTALCAHFGIPYAVTTTGLLSVLEAILLLGILPGQRYSSLTDFGVLFFAGVSLAFSGLNGLGVIGNWAIPVAGWLMFFDGCCGMWSCLSTMNSFGGMKMHLGPSLFKQKQSDVASGSSILVED